jgi:hypothetical protein
MEVGAPTGAVSRSSDAASRTMITTPAGGDQGVKPPRPPRMPLRSPALCGIRTAPWRSPHPCALSDEERTLRAFGHKI